jgi:hypothetical protein
MAAQRPAIQPRREIGMTEDPRACCEAAGIIAAFSKPSAFAGCRFRFRAYTVAIPMLAGP